MSKASDARDARDTRDAKGDYCDIAAAALRMARPAFVPNYEQACEAVEHVTNFLLFSKDRRIPRGLVDSRVCQKDGRNLGGLVRLARDIYQAKRERGQSIWNAYTRWRLDGHRFEGQTLVSKSDRATAFSSPKEWGQRMQMFQQEWADPDTKARFAEIFRRESADRESALRSAGSVASLLASGEPVVPRRREETEVDAPEAPKAPDAATVPTPEVPAVPAVVAALAGSRKSGSAKMSRSESPAAIPAPSSSKRAAEPPRDSKRAQPSKEPPKPTKASKPKPSRSSRSSKRKEPEPETTATETEATDASDDSDDSEESEDSEASDDSAAGRFQKEYRAARESMLSAGREQARRAMRRILG